MPGSEHVPQAPANAPRASPFSSPSADTWLETWQFADIWARFASQKQGKERKEAKMTVKSSRIVTQLFAMAQRFIPGYKCAASKERKYVGQRNCTHMYNAVDVLISPQHLERM